CQPAGRQPLLLRAAGHAVAAAQLLRPGARTAPRRAPGGRRRDRRGRGRVLEGAGLGLAGGGPLRAGRRALRRHGPQGTDSGRPPQPSADPWWRRAIHDSVVQCADDVVPCVAEFGPGTLSFVYRGPLPASGSVESQLAALWPKLAVGGVLAGAELDPKVRKAVIAFFAGTSELSTPDLLRCPRQVMLSYRTKGAEWDSCNVYMTVHGVNFDLLSQDEVLSSAFEAKVKEALIGVLKKAQSIDVSPEGILLQLRRGGEDSEPDPKMTVGRRLGEPGSILVVATVTPPAGESLAKERTFSAASGRSFVIAQGSYPAAEALPREVRPDVASACEGDLLELLAMQGDWGYGRRFKEREGLVNEGAFLLGWVHGVRQVIEDGRRRPVEVDVHSAEFGFRPPRAGDVSAKLRQKRWLKKMSDAASA
ncbi:unnamed protein product, partial [Prorocentrum cordatum]